MKESLFIQIVEKWFAAISGKVSEFINGRKDEPKYLYQSMLTESFTPTMKWDAASLNNTRVAAEVVEMDSPLPLIKRDSFSVASGNIPKIGVMLQKNESQIKEIQIMMQVGSTEAQIVPKIFDDTKRCSVSVAERLELMFLEGVSTGYTLIAGDGDKGIRVDYKFPDSNKFGATKAWGSDGFTPISDVQRVIAAADQKGYTITKIMLSERSLNKMRNSVEGRRLAASFAGSIIVNTADLPTPNRSSFQMAFKDETGVDLLVVNRTIYSEKNGIRTPRKPFEEDTLVFLTADNVGRLVYTSLVEESNPVSGVMYQKIGSYILISKYSETKPFSEFTTAEAMALPVIDDVDSIFLLHTQEAIAMDAAEVDGDTTITIYNKQVVKTKAIEALKQVGVLCPSNIGDAKLIEKINALSDADEARFKELVLAV